MGEDIGRMQIGGNRREKMCIEEQIYLLFVKTKIKVKL